MADETTTPRLPLLIVVGILIIILALALFWPESDTPEMQAPLRDTSLSDPLLNETTLPQLNTQDAPEIVSEDFTPVMPVGEANVDELMDTTEAYVEPVVVTEAVAPTMDLSDRAIKQTIITALSSPMLSTLLVNDDIIANVVATTLNTAQGSLPENVAILTPPRQDFAVFKQANNFFITPESFTRYNVYAQTFAHIETNDLLALLNQYAPQINSQFEQIAPPNTSFNTTLINAINRLLDTPSVNLPIAVISDSAMYQFANPQLEALLPVQKQLLRMGPDNMRIIKAKLRELRTRLEQQSTQ